MYCCYCIIKIAKASPKAATLKLNYILVHEEVKLDKDEHDKHNDDRAELANQVGKSSHHSYPVGTGCCRQRRLVGSSAGAAALAVFLAA